jgi:hypothetical protein
VTPQLHAELAALSLLYKSGEISEEEWALLQIHMAYCDSCHRTFLQDQKIVSYGNPAASATA